MFHRFTTPEGMAMVVRTSRIAAFTALEEGGTRLFLGGSLSCIVREGVDEVERVLSPAADED